MAEEEKKDVVEETGDAVESTEAGESTEGKKGKSKSKGKSVDVNAIINNVKGGVDTGSQKVTAMVKEADDKKKMMIFLAIIAIEVVLSLVGGVNAIILIVEILVAAVGFIALKAAFPGSDEAKEEKAE